MNLSGESIQIGDYWVEWDQYAVNQIEVLD